jgi:hypothetical protein
MLAYNPDDRITATRCLENPIFKEFRDQERDQSIASLKKSAGIQALAMRSMYQEKSKFHSGIMGSSRR